MQPHFSADVETLTEAQTGGFVKNTDELLATIPHAAGLIPCLTEMSLHTYWNYLGHAQNDELPLYSDWVLVWNQILTEFMGGDNWHETLDGRFIALMFHLERHNLSSPVVSSTVQEAGRTRLPFPLTFDFDLEEYFLPVANIKRIDWKQGGTSTMDSVTDRDTTLMLYGKYLAIMPPQKRRKWIQLGTADGRLNFPNHRYHCIVLMNTKADDANAWEGGLSVDGPNFRMQTIDSRILQTRFAAKWPLQDSLIGVYNEALVPGYLHTPSDYVENVFCPLYLPDRRTLRFEGGVQGPFQVRRMNVADPATMDAFALVALP